MDVAKEAINQIWTVLGALWITVHGDSQDFLADSSIDLSAWCVWFISASLFTIIPQNKAKSEHYPWTLIIILLKSDIDLP